MSKYQNTLIILSIMLAFVGGVYFFNNTPNPDEQPDYLKSVWTEPTNYQNNDNAPPVLEVNAENKYQHKKVLRPIFKKDVKVILSIWDNPEKLEKWMKEIAERPVAEQGDIAGLEKQKWDLNKLPTSQQEYDNFIEEALHNSLFKMSQGIVDKNPSLVRKAFSGYRAVKILDGLDFHGYDENKNLMLKLPEDFVAQNNRILRKNRAQLKKRRVANTDEEPASVSTTDSEEEQINLEALFDEKLKQTVYFSDLETSTTRMDEYWGGDSHFFASLTQAADFIINFLANNDFFKITPTQAQEQIEEVIGETLEEARANPRDFGIFPSKIPRDVADLDYEILAEALSREVAIQYALLGAGLSTILGDLIINSLQGARVFAAGLLVAIGVETFFASLGAYWGTYLLLQLHRYQTYIRDAKEIITADGKEFLISQIPPFDPNLVFFSETTRIEMNKSWLWGFGFGLLANRYATVGLWGKIGTWFAHRAAEMSASNKFVIRGTGIVVWNLFELMTDSIGTTLAKLLRLPINNAGIVGRILTLFQKALGATPARIASIIIDFALTGIIVYTAIHTRLFASSKMLNRIYYAPEMTVHLALNDKFHQFEPFVEASRKIFYPICQYAASKDLNRQRMTPAEEGKGSNRIKGIFDTRLSSCLKIIAAMEGVHETRIESHLRGLVTDGKLSAETFSLFYSDKELEQEKLVDSIVKAHTEYPEYYQIIWTTALKAIFSYGEVPDQFYSIKNLIIAGDGGHLHENYSSYFEFSSFAGAKKINAIRFEYILERLAYRAREIKIEKGKATSEDPLDLSEAFVVFWNFQRDNLKEYDREILDLLRAEEKGFWAALWEGLESAKSNIQFLINRWLEPLYNTTYRFHAEQAIEEVLENQ